MAWRCSTCDRLLCGCRPETSRPARAEQRTRRVSLDSWVTVDENMRAILRTLEALHAIERSGSAQIEDRAFEVTATPPIISPRVAVAVPDDGQADLDFGQEYSRDGSGAA